MRLTPEREQEIRERPFDCGYGECLVERQELLDAIDELRDELKEWVNHDCSVGKAINDAKIIMEGR